MMVEKWRRENDAMVERDQTENDAREHPQKHFELTTFYVAGLCLRNVRWAHRIFWVIAILVPWISSPYRTCVYVSENLSKLILPQPENVCRRHFTPPACPDGDRLFFMGTDKTTYIVPLCVVFILTVYEVVAFRKLALVYAQIEQGKNLPFKILRVPVKCGFWFAVMLIISFWMKMPIFNQGIIVSQGGWAYEKNCTIWMQFDEKWHESGNPIPLGQAMLAAWLLMLVLPNCFLALSEGPLYGSDVDYEFGWAGNRSGYSRRAAHFEDRWRLSKLRKSMCAWCPCFDDEKSTACYTIMGGEGENINSEAIRDLIEQFQKKLAVLAEIRVADIKVRLKDRRENVVDLKIEFPPEHGPSFAKDCPFVKNLLGDMIRNPEGRQGFSRVQVLRSVERSVWHADVLRVKATGDRMFLVRAGNLEWTVTRAKQKLEEGKLDEAFSMVWKECERCSMNIWARTMFENLPVTYLQLKVFSIALDLDNTNKGPGQYDPQMLFTAVTSLVSYLLSLNFNYADLVKLWELRREMRHETGGNQSLTEDLTRAGSCLFLGGCGLVIASLGFLYCCKVLVSLVFR